jgi:hypothetical protein
VNLLMVGSYWRGEDGVPLPNMKFLKSALAIFPFVAACGLSSGNIQSKQATDLEARRIRRIAVLAPAPSAMAPAKSALPGVPAEKKTEVHDPDEVLFRLVYSALVAIPTWQVVLESEVKDAGSSVASVNDTARLRKVGEMVYADGVISGRMLRYRERIGGDIGVQSPASVAFTLDLIDVQRGDVIWSARFDETQKGLSENIFALGDIRERGIRWLTAEQLAQDGVRKAVNQLHEAILHGRAP